MLMRTRTGTMMIFGSPFRYRVAATHSGCFRVSRDAPLEFVLGNIPISLSGLGEFPRSRRSPLKQFREPSSCVTGTSRNPNRNLFGTLLEPLGACRDPPNPSTEIQSSPNSMTNFDLSIVPRMSQSSPPRSRAPMHQVTKRGVVACAWFDQGPWRVLVRLQWHWVDMVSVICLFSGRRSRPLART